MDASKKKKIFYDILLVAGILMLAGAFVYFYFFYKDYSDAIAEYESIQKEYTTLTVDPPVNAVYDSKDARVIDIDNDNESDDDQTITDEMGDEALIHHIDYMKGDIAFDRLIPQQIALWYDMISVNVSGLMNRNPEVRGWIFFEKGDISYPIMQGDDNEKYLSLTMGGAVSKAGSIFMDYENAGDFSDSRVVIYGHNMKNESMFGSLKYYKKKGYYDDNRFFQIITPYSKKRYEIFSCFDIADSETDMVKTDYIADEDFRLFINHLKNKSVISGKVYTDANSHIVSLVTCSNTGHRLLVTGVLVDTH